MTDLQGKERNKMSAYLWYIHMSVITKYALIYDQIEI